MRRHLRRNYIVHFVEGGLFSGGLAFIAMDSVLPTMVRSLGGPNWLISLMPMLLFLGFMWPPLFMAHVTEKLHSLKRFAVLLGVPQRLPFLLAGCALWFWAEDYPRLVLVLVALSPLMAGICGGIVWGAWVELTSRMIPPNRRSSVMALRAIFGAGIGIFAGSVIKTVLENNPGPQGYAILHFIAFGVAMLSFLAFLFIKEPRRIPDTKTSQRGLIANLKSMPAIVRGDTRFRFFVIGQAFGAGFFIMTPFLAIHALEVVDRGEAFLGVLVQAQMIGNISGNFLAGWIGDRWGGRIVLLWSKLIFIALALGAIYNVAEWGFMLLFFLFGFGFSFHLVGRSTLSIEICPEVRRPTYLALMQFLLLPAMLVSAVLATTVREVFGTLQPAAILAAIAMTLSYFFLRKIQEPRGGLPNAAPSDLSTRVDSTPTAS